MLNLENEGKVPYAAPELFVYYVCYYFFKATMLKNVWDLLV